jgi:hypothetical protein
MANPVVGTAVCNCSFGAAPMPLQVVSQQTVHVCGMMAATIMDNVCTTFGMCSNPANPAVASATAAAFGVLTPMPCVPVTPAPWMPGCPTVTVCKRLLLNSTSKLMCAYGGVISVTMTPAVTVKTP